MEENRRQTAWDNEPMAQTTKQAPTQIPPAPPTIGPGLPEDSHHGPGFSRVANVNVRQLPAATRSGELSPQQSSRQITANPVDGTNPRTIDRANIDASVYGNSTHV